MDLALALLLLWGLLFVPIGLVLHWLVLGEGARVRALPLAPVTGVSVAFVTLATLGRIGVDAGEPAVAIGFLVVSVACAIAIWRGDIVWYSRELVGAGFLLLFAVLLVQLPVISQPGDGPLGYGTAADPVDEVAAIEVAAQGPSAGLAVARQAERDAEERPIGFEQFAALTVGIGQDDSRRPPADQSWTAYTLHAPITGLLAALITLPLFAFAKARGLRWFGLMVLAPLGALAPSVFLALANGEGAAISSVALTTAAVFSLLVTRRDRGWWALVVLFGAGVAVTAGPLALLPLVAIGISWMFLRSDTYEHLSQHDTPVAPARTLAVTALAAIGGVLASLPLFVQGGGELLAWSPLHATMLDAIRSWPFAWLDSDLSTAGPDGPLETVIWLIGPALLAVALIYAVVRNERRELGVLVGVLVAAAFAAAVGIADATAGIRLFEFVMLSSSPFLAALAIRAVALARENAEDFKGTRQERLAGLGPTIFVLGFVLLSFAATAVTGTRMVHAPSDIASANPLDASGTGVPAGDGQVAKNDEPTLIAAGDPWLEFALDGERVEGGYADADALVQDNEYVDRNIWRESYFGQLVLSSSPLSSDPPLRWLEQSTLDPYQVRGFVDQRTNRDAVPDDKVDRARLDQRQKSAVSDRPGAETPSGAAPDPAAPADGSSAANDVADAAGAAIPAQGDNARYHIPVEGVGRNTPPDRPAGLLLPADDVIGCGSAADVVNTTCEPAEPVVGDGCSKADVAAARSPIDRENGRRPKDTPGARPQVMTIPADPNLSLKPPLLGVQCFDVPVARDSSVLLVHLRDIGLILPPEQAAKVPRGVWETEREQGRLGGSRGVNGGTRLRSSELEATLQYGGMRLQGDGWDLVLEGDFGAGVSIASEQAALSTNGELIQGIEPLELGRFRGSADGFSMILRNVALTGSVSVINTAGTDVSLGRLFARPRDLPRSCDVPIAVAEGEQREIRMDVANLTGGSTVRPGLTVSVAKLSGSGAKRTAHVVVGSYLSRNGLPRYTLVDWTEIFESSVEVDACDGTVYREEGAVPLASDAAVSERETADAFGGDAGK